MTDDDEAPRLALGGKFYMTPAGHARLRAELDQLTRVERPRIVEIVSWAASNGDRSENADSHGKVSLTSPIAIALIKARAMRGTEVSVHTPRGVESIEVVSISYPSP